MIDLAGVPGAGRRPAPASTRSSSSAATAAFNPEPLADFVDVVVLGDGEEVVGEITEVVGAWKRGGRADSRGACCASSPQVPGVYVPVDVRRRLRRPRASSPSRRATPTCPPTVDKRTVADLGEWPYPKQPARAADRGRPRPAQRRGVPRLHPGLPLLPGGDDHPPGARAPGRAGAHDGRATGLRRTGYDEVSLTSLSTADFSDIEPRRRRRPRRPRAGQPGCPTTVNLPSLRVDAFTVGLAGAGQQRPAQRADVRPRGRLVAAALGDQQADHRGRPVRRRRGAFAAGLDADEAVLPHRPADRDRRGHARASPSWPATASRSDAATPAGRR